VKSVSNSSNLLEQFWVRVETRTELLQWFYQMKTPDLCFWACFHLKTRPLQAQIFRSNYVFEFRLYCNTIYTWIMQCLELFHLLVSNLESEQYLLSHCWKPTIWVWFWVLFHSNSMDTDWIVNWRPGRERASKTTSFIYKPCHDIIRTRKFNCSQNCSNSQIKQLSSSNLAKNLQFYVRFIFQPHQETPGQTFGWVWNWMELFLQSKPRPLMGYPNLFLILSVK
jgi:hypothetical protein